MKKITTKLGKMRKAVDWVVYPPQKDGRTIIQADNYIAVFGPDGRGLLSKRQGGGAYFVHLSPACGATPVEVPQEVVQEVLAAQPKSGDEVGPGVRFA